MEIPCRIEAFPNSAMYLANHGERHRTVEMTPTHNAAAQRCGCRTARCRSMLPNGFYASFMVSAGPRMPAAWPFDRTLNVSHPGSKGTVTEMKKNKRDSIREERIQNEAIVDAYGPEEQALGWYYYLEDKIHFPFQAKCIVAKTVSPLLKGETVKVRRMAPEDACSSDMLVLIAWHGRNVAVPLSQLTPLDADDSTAEAIGDWHYWVAQGYCF